MKQHITIEQLKELSDKEKNKLRDWCGCELGSVFAYHSKDTDIWYEYAIGDEDDDNIVSYPSGKSQMAYPLPSIGQMIAFLEEYRKLWTIKQEYVQGENEDGMILDHNRWNIFRENTSAPFYSERELCDLLWEAVKEVLENEEAR